MRIRVERGNWGDKLLNIWGSTKIRNLKKPGDQGYHPRDFLNFIRQQSLNISKKGNGYTDLLFLPDVRKHICHNKSLEGGALQLLLLDLENLWRLWGRTWDVATKETQLHPVMENRSGCYREEHKTTKCFSFFGLWLNIRREFWCLHLQGKIIWFD